MAKKTKTFRYEVVEPLDSHHEDVKWKGSDYSEALRVAKKLSREKGVPIEIQMRKGRSNIVIAQIEE